MKRTSNRHGFTRTELVVVLVVVGALIAVGISYLYDALLTGQAMASLSNGRQIYMATCSMAKDSKSSEDQSIGWPGDLVASGSMQCTVKAFVRVLVGNRYSSIGDLAVFSAPGLSVFRGSDINQFIAKPGPDNECAYTIYCVQESDTGSAIFLSTINSKLNVSNTTFDLDSKAVPFGDKRYVIFHKDGSGIILRRKQASDSSLQGTPCKMALSGTAALRTE